MAYFTYTAHDPGGQTRQGVLVAPSRRDALRVLSARGLKALAIGEEPNRFGSRTGSSVATANPSSFLACSSLTANPFFRASATVICGSELL